MSQRTSPTPIDKTSKMDMTANEEEWDDSLLCKAYTKAVKKANEIIKDIPAEHIPDININECAASVDWKWKKVEDKSRAWRVGMRCRAIFSEDGEEYEAVIDSIEGSTAKIKFEGYNSSQSVELATLQPTLGHKAVEEQQVQAHLDNIYLFECERRRRSYYRNLTMTRWPSPPPFNPEDLVLSEDDYPGVLYERSDSSSSNDFVCVPNRSEMCDRNISYSTSDEENGTAQPSRSCQASPQDIVKNEARKYFDANFKNAAQVDPSKFFGDNSDSSFSLSIVHCDDTQPSSSEIPNKEPPSSHVPPNPEGKKQLEPSSGQGSPQEQGKLYIEAFPRPPTPRGLTKFFIPGYKGINSQGKEEMYVNATSVPGPPNPQGLPQFFLEASTMLGPPKLQLRPDSTEDQFHAGYLHMCLKDSSSFVSVNHSSEQSKPEGQRVGQQNAQKGFGNSNEQNKPEKPTPKVTEKQNSSQKPNNFIGPGFFKLPTIPIVPKSTVPSGTQEKNTFSQSLSHSQSNPQGPNTQGQKYAQYPQGPQVQGHGNTQGQGNPKAQSYSQGQGYPQGHGYHQGQSYTQSPGYAFGQYPQGQWYSQGQSYTQSQGPGYPQAQGYAPLHGYSQGQGYPKSQGPGFPQGQGYPHSVDHSRSYPQGSSYAHYQGYPLNYSQRQAPTYNSNFSQQYAYSAEPLSQPQRTYAVLQQCLGPMTLAAPANGGVVGPIPLPVPLNNSAPIPTYVASAPVNVVPAPANIAPGPINFSAPLNNTGPILPYGASAPVNAAPAPANTATGQITFVAPSNNNPLFPSYVAPGSVTSAPGQPNLTSGIADALSNLTIAKSNPPELFKFTARSTNVATDKSQAPELPGPPSAAPGSSTAAQVKPLPPTPSVRQRKVAQPADEVRRFEVPPMPNMEELISTIAPPAPPLPFPLAEVLSESDRVQSSMLLSWYSSGYYTGLYQAMMKNSKNGE